MTAIERSRPPMNAGERDTLLGWLTFHRETLALKCEGLTDEQAATASAGPSPFTMIGLVQHLTEVERTWSRRVFAGEELPSVYGPADAPPGPDGGFDLAPGATLAEALRAWRQEIDVATAATAGHALEETGSFLGQAVSLRWIHVHLIEEYARHNGHADLVRERIDGVTGV